MGIYFKDEVVSLNFEQKKLTESVIEYIAQAVLRTQLVDELEQAKVISETERLRSALLSSVSHDLRSPLASIIGAADTLANFKADMSEQDQQDLLETIHLEGERLDRYIQNLLDMTRLGHEGLTLKRDWIGVDELIGSATRRLKRYKRDTQVIVQLPEQPISLYVHPALVEQAIFNVLENAANFSPPDEPVMIRAQLSSEDEVKIEIEDRGAGIPEDERHRIFDMFYTMERGDRGKFGTGLGLTIVKAIIGAHMGTIEAFSGRQNKGTFNSNQITHSPSKRISCKFMISSETSPVETRIVIIDDEPQIRKFLDIALRTQKYKTTLCETGYKGLEALATQGADLVILDLGLPDLDGKEVLQELRSWSNVPVIVLSVRADEYEKVALLDAGANDYMTKPFSVQELLARIRVILRNQPIQQEAHVYDDGYLKVDVTQRLVWIEQQPITLTRKEFQLLTLLMRYQGQLLTQPQLLKELWGPTHQEDTHYLRILVGKLRSNWG